ncbi:MAG: dockerin type I repeat-containing protein, partial [Oscillospiraceae bacterium]|nr:dockerin type I repeat-containing protein [Oscillospiraceae bacterium]
IDNPNMADEISCGLYDCVYANGGSTLKIEPHPCYQDIVQMMQQLPEQKALTGDATCDGAVDVADAVLILRYAIADAEAKITDQGVKNGDVNASGQTDADDAALVLQFIAKKTTF